MTALQRAIIRERYFGALFFGVVGLALAFAAGVVWLDIQGWGKRLVFVIALAVGLAFYFGISYSLIHSLGVIKGRFCWDDGLDAKGFTETVARRRVKLEAKLQ